MTKQDVPAETRIFDRRFVDQIKNKGTEKAFEKSRLIVQAFNDSGKHGILTQASIIQRASQRLTIALSLTISEFSLYSRNITQTYTQSRSELARDVFILAPVEMGQSMRTALRTYHKLYGIAESGTHWFQTYHKHHVDKLEMIPTFDTCLLFNKNMTAIIDLQRLSSKAIYVEGSSRARAQDATTRAQQSRVESVREAGGELRKFLD